MIEDDVTDVEDLLEPTPEPSPYVEPSVTPTQQPTPTPTPTPIPESQMMVDKLLEAFPLMTSAYDPNKNPAANPYLSSMGYQFVGEATFDQAYQVAFDTFTSMIENEEIKEDEVQLHGFRMFPLNDVELRTVAIVYYKVLTTEG